MTAAGGRPRPRWISRTELAFEYLSERDWNIIHSLYRLRLATLSQLVRLHFTTLTSPGSRKVVSNRVLKRLVDRGVLMRLAWDVRLPEPFGPDERYFKLDKLGYRVLQIWYNREEPDVNVWPSPIPGERFVPHILSVSELYVSLVEASRSEAFEVSAFDAGAAAHVADGLGGQIRPDAFVELSNDKYYFSFWYECDRGTESLPVIRAKLNAYLDFVYRGQRGPNGIVPLVLFGVITDNRLKAIQAVVRMMPQPADRMFQVVTMADAPQFMLNKLLTQAS